MLRINKYIAQSGLCSRRKADEYIEKKLVKINGRVVKDKGISVNEKTDMVTVDGKKLTLEKKKIYIMLNKPKGYVTTSNDQFGRLCVADLIKEDVRVFPVGRLDYETEGLLILTNDGDFANELMHPSKKINKVYIARVKGNITEEKLNKLRKGVSIDEYITAPALVEQIKENEIKITIHEGKNRQVRKMCESIDLEVKNLKRIRIGKLELGKLETGKYKLLKQYQMKNLF